MQQQSVLLRRRSVDGDACESDGFPPVPAQSWRRQACARSAQLPAVRQRLHLEGGSSGSDSAGRSRDGRNKRIRRGQGGHTNSGDDYGVVIVVTRSWSDSDWTDDVTLCVTVLSSAATASTTLHGSRTYWPGPRPRPATQSWRCNSAPSDDSNPATTASHRHHLRQGRSRSFWRPARRAAAKWPAIRQLQHCRTTPSWRRHGAAATTLGPVPFEILQAAGTAHSGAAASGAAYSSARSTRLDCTSTRPHGCHSGARWRACVHTRMRHRPLPRPPTSLHATRRTAARMRVPALCARCHVQLDGGGAGVRTPTFTTTTSTTATTTSTAPSHYAFVAAMRGWGEQRATCHRHHLRRRDRDPSRADPAYQRGKRRRVPVLCAR